MEAMTSEREAFEVSVRQWPTFKDSFLAHDGRYPDYYGNPVVQGAWEGWKARAHLAQPAQAVDVGAIREVIVRLNEIVEMADRDPDEFYSFDLDEQADKLTRALSVQKAGPVGDDA